MNKKILIKRSVFYCLLLFSIINFVSCAGGEYLTTQFQAIQSIPAGKALVYVYRPYKDLGCAIHYAVNANKKPISRYHLYVNGYIPYFAEPGLTIFSAQVDNWVTDTSADLKAGSIYYIRGSVEEGTWIGAPFLELVNPDRGQKEIAECRLIGESVIFENNQVNNIPDTLTNDKIIEMTTNNLSATYIIDKIQHSKTEFDLSKKAISRLNRQIVDLSVIEEMKKYKKPNE